MGNTLSWGDSLRVTIIPFVWGGFLHRTEMISLDHQYGYRKKKETQLRPPQNKAVALLPSSRSDGILNVPAKQTDGV